MAELIAIGILLGSIVGMGMIIWRKIPVLAELPEASSQFSFENRLLKLKEKIKFLNPFRYFSGEIFLQKILSKMRILALRFENKIATWLQILREKSRQKKSLKEDNYWQRLKKSTEDNKKKSPRDKKNKNLPG